MTALEQALLRIKYDAAHVKYSTQDIRDAAAARVVASLADTVQRLAELLLEVESKRL